MPEIDWNAENTRIVCKLFAEQVERGNRPSTYLNVVCYAEVEKGFNKWAVSQHASDGDTDEPSFVTMDTFRDSMATSVAIAWN